MDLPKSRAWLLQQSMMPTETFFILNLKRTFGTKLDPILGKIEL
jgi:hypothetical protein